MDDITIFDIYNQKWYHQKATGDVPAPRIRFCISGAQETRANFYEIFVFGGTTGIEYGPSNVDFHQVYILTLPAFRWIRATNSSTISRTAPRCLVNGNRQMLAIGGDDTTAATVGFGYPVVDPCPYGLGIFAITPLEWTHMYGAAAIPYVQSDEVKAYYSKGSTYPNSWNDPLLEAILTNSTSASTTTPKSGAQGNQAAHHNSASGCRLVCNYDFFRRDMAIFLTGV